MNDMPVWQIVLMHAAPFITALAAWRSANRGANTSKRNEDAILVVHGLVNGQTAALKSELDAARKELEALKAHGRN